MKSLPIVSVTASVRSTTSGFSRPLRRQRRRIMRPPFIGLGVGDVHEGGELLHRQPTLSHHLADGRQRGQRGGDLHPILRRPARHQVGRRHPLRRIETTVQHVGVALDQHRQDRRPLCFRGAHQTAEGAVRLHQVIGRSPAVVVDEHVFDHKGRTPTGHLKWCEAGTIRRRPPARRRTGAACAPVEGAS